MPRFIALRCSPLRARPRVILAVSTLLLAAPQSVRAQSAMFDNFPRTSPRAGERAPDFTLLSLDNEPFHLLAAAAEKPVVLEFGSFT